MPLQLSFLLSHRMASALYSSFLFFFFFNDTATTEIYTLSLHDALPICHCTGGRQHCHGRLHHHQAGNPVRSEEHTSELQSRQYLVCRLLLEKKKTDTLTASPHFIYVPPVETLSSCNVPFIDDDVAVNRC